MAVIAGDIKYGIQFLFFYFLVKEVGDTPCLKGPYKQLVCGIQGDLNCTE
jgi:hypothetical protein